MEEKKDGKACCCTDGKCCCTDNTKLIGAVVLLLLGGVIGYLMGGHGCRCGKMMKGCPMPMPMSGPAVPGK